MTAPHLSILLGVWGMGRRSQRVALGKLMKEGQKRRGKIGIWEYECRGSRGEMFRKIK